MMTTMLCLLMSLVAASAFTTPSASKCHPSFLIGAPTSSRTTVTAKISFPLYSEQTSTESIDSSSANNSDDEDLHPSDAAATTPEFLAALWQLIAKGNHMVRGVSIAGKRSIYC